MEKRHGNKDPRNPRFGGIFTVILACMFIHSAAATTIETTTKQSLSNDTLYECSNTFVCGGKAAHSSITSKCDKDFKYLRCEAGYALDNGIWTNKSVRITRVKAAHTELTCHDHDPVTVLCGWSKCDENIAAAVRKCDKVVGVCGGKTWDAPNKSLHVLCPIAFDLDNGMWKSNTTLNASIKGSNSTDFECDTVTANKIEGYCHGDNCDKDGVEKLSSELSKACKYEEQYGTSTSTEAAKAEEGSILWYILGPVIGIAVLALLGLAGFLGYLRWIKYMNWKVNEEVWKKDGHVWNKGRADALAAMKKAEAERRAQLTESQREREDAHDKKMWAELDEMAAKMPPQETYTLEELLNPETCDDKSLKLGFPKRAMKTDDKSQKSAKSSTKSAMKAK